MLRARGKKRQIRWLAGGLSLLLAILLLGGCGLVSHAQPAPLPEPESSSQPSPLPSSRPEPAVGTDELLEVVVLDVGQGDSVFVRQGEHVMLIDAGTRKASDTVVGFLSDENVETIDVLVGTHPHEDHIGGLSAVMDAFPVQTLYMPKVQHNTRTFEDLLDAMERNALKAREPDIGETFALGQAQCTVLSPGGKRHKDLNDESIVIRIQWGETSFLFCGDAEEQSEKEMLESGLPLASTVLKVGHHGSRTSTTPDFLEAVQPDIAVISLAQDNSYGHPHEETLTALEAAQAEIYRTDLHGFIILTSDGTEVTVSCRK